MAETKNTMGMENIGGSRREFIPEEGTTELTASELRAREIARTKNNHSGIGRKFATAAIAAGTFLSPEMQASKAAIAKAEKAVVEATYDLSVAKEDPENKADIQAAEKALALAKADVEIAKAEDEDEEKLSRTQEDDEKLFTTANTEKVAAGRGALKRKYDADGNLISELTTSEKTKAQLKHDEKLAKIAAGVAKKQADASRPVIIHRSGYGSRGVVYRPGVIRNRVDTGHTGSIGHTGSPARTGTKARTGTMGTTGGTGGAERTTTSPQTRSADSSSGRRNPQGGSRSR